MTLLARIARLEAIMALLRQLETVHYATQADALIREIQSL
jgi:hypothetical protein